MGHHGRAAIPAPRRSRGSSSTERSAGRWNGGPDGRSAGWPAGRGGRLCGHANVKHGQYPAGTPCFGPRFHPLKHADGVCIPSSEITDRTANTSNTAFPAASGLVKRNATPNVSNDGSCFHIRSMFRNRPRYRSHCFVCGPNPTDLVGTSKIGSAFEISAEPRNSPGSSPNRRFEDKPHRSNGGRGNHHRGGRNLNLAV